MNSIAAGSRTKVALVYPFDPFGSKVGGVETFVRGFVRHAPSDIDILHVGITSGVSRRALGVETELEIGGRKITHIPILFEEDENTRAAIPLSLRFAWALLSPRFSFIRKKLKNRVLLFNKLEPAVVFLHWDTPLIGFVHNDIPQQLKPSSEYAWSKFPAAYFAVERQILSRMSHTYTVNNNTLRLYKKRYGSFSEKIDFLPTWVDDDVFGPSSNKSDVKARVSKKYGIPANEEWCLFVGRLQKQKNPQLMLKSFRKLLDRRPSARLVIVGEGNLLSETKALAQELSIQDSVSFVSFVSQESLADFYQASDILLLTSAFEGMPRCVLESLGCGLPVVTTDVGEVKLVVRPGLNGQIVEEADPEVIAGAVYGVLEKIEQYRVQHCLDGVEEFRPKKVLSSVYEKCRELTRSKSLV